MMQITRHLHSRPISFQITPLHIKMRKKFAKVGWKMLIDKNMKRIEMQYLTGISGNILARMGKNQYVSMETIEKICKKLDCTIDEMMEFTDDE